MQQQPAKADRDGMAPGSARADSDVFKDSDGGFRCAYGQMGPFLGAQTNGGLEQREGEKRTSINQVCGAPPPRPRARCGGALQLQLQLLLQCC
jgi:hypothetical protein